MPNFGAIACVGPAAGHQSHTHFHLYIIDLLLDSTLVTDSEHSVSRDPIMILEEFSN